MNNTPVSVDFAGLKFYRLLRVGSKIKRIAWSPNGKILAVGLVDNTLRLWDVEMGELQPEIGEHDHPVSDIIWSQNGQTIVTVTKDKAIYLWEVGTTLKQLWKINIRADQTANVAWSPDEHINIAMTTDAFTGRMIIQTLDKNNGEFVLPVKDVPGKKSLVTVSADRRILALSVPENKSVRIWNVSTCELIDTIPWHKDQFYWNECQLYSVAVSPDKQTIVVTIPNGIMWIWPIKIRHLFKCRVHTEPIYSTSFSADGRIFASKSMDGTVGLWRCDTWEHVVSFKEQSYEQVDLAFHPTIHRLATFDENNTAIRLWDIDVDTLLSVQREEAKDINLNESLAKITNKKDAKKAAVIDNTEVKRELLRQHYRNLDKLKLQAAKYGSVEVPLHLLNQIEDEEKQIAQLQKELADYNEGAKADTSSSFSKPVETIYIGEIRVGDTFNMSGDFRNSILNIKSTLSDVSQSINTIPNADDSIKHELRELVNQLNEELQKVPPEKKEEAEAVAETTKSLVEVVSKEKPNKAMVQVSAEGLKQAAKNLATVTPVILTIATQIVTTIMKIVG